MKISGSYAKTIHAMTRSGFSFDESRTINETTQKLAQEGKHIINIIHGTPYKLLGDTCKELTFLWEADDEDPIYQSYIQSQEKQKLKDAQKQRISTCKNEIATLKTRIQNAEKPTQATKGKGGAIACIISGIFACLAGIICIDSGGFIVIIIGALILLFGIISLNGIGGTENQALVDKSQLETLQKQLCKKEKELSELVEQYHKI